MNCGAENIGGFLVGTTGVRATVADILRHLRSPGCSNQCRWLACLNPHSYTVALSDSLFSNALDDADWLIPDGSGVVLTSRILGGEIRERVTGSDVFEGITAALNNNGGGRVFFLGSTDRTLKMISERFALDYPSLEVAGTYSPPFTDSFSTADTDRMIDLVNAARADVLWVGMTAPKQEKWLYEACPRLNVRFAGAIGAVFDFYVGQVKRSHPLFQRLHLEWLPRLVQEPRRLWRRMVISAPIFIWYALIKKRRAIKRSD